MGSHGLTDRTPTHDASERETPPPGSVFSKSVTSGASSSLVVGDPPDPTSSTRGPGALLSGLALTPASSLDPEPGHRGLSLAADSSTASDSPLAAEISLASVSSPSSDQSAKSSLSDPVIAEKALTLPAVVNSQNTACVLADSGSQADVISPDFARRIDLSIRQLVSPVTANLAAEGKQVSLSLCTTLDSLEVGISTLADRPVFVCALPPGIDMILGLPWFKDSGMAVSATALFVAPSGPSTVVYDFRSGIFVAALSPSELQDCGFVSRPMLDCEFSEFLTCALVAGVRVEEVTAAAESVGLKPHNPLLDEDNDDPASPDVDEAEAARALDALTSEFADILVDDLPGPPPFRPVNHEIKLVDPHLKIRSRAFPMPDRYKEQFADQVRKFVSTGFWSPAALDSACSLFAVPKADRSKARFVVNLKPRNLNTVRMASPIPDMRDLRNRVAAHKVRSKLDMRGAYEQIRVTPESVPLTGFITPAGTFVSHVMQQGDTNAPETMHRVVGMMFQQCIGRFLESFYDDLLVYSHTRRAHLRYLRIVFMTLRHYRFYLSRSKVELMVPRMAALGAEIDDDGIRVVPDRWSVIQNWPTPKSPKDILRFMGVLQFMNDHLPQLNVIAAPLTRLTSKKVAWEWGPAEQLAFDRLRSLVPQCLKPLDLDKLRAGSERLFVFTDASVAGCGGWLGQGPSYPEARAFRFISSKFNRAQVNYHTTDQELLAVFVACKKLHEHLVGWRFVVVCDHEPLRTYWQQPVQQTRRHARIWELLSQYDIEWQFIPGKSNSVADSLSRLAELDGTDGLALPDADEPSPAPDDDEPFPTEMSPRAQLAMAGLIAASASASVSDAVRSFSLAALTPPAIERVTALTPYPEPVIADFRSATASDPLGKKVLANPAAYPAFSVLDGLLFIGGDSGWRLVVPSGRVSSMDDPVPTFVELVVGQAHKTVGHLGVEKTLEFVRRSYWWRDMVRDVDDYVKSCESCRRGKAPTTKPFGWLHPLDVPTRPFSKVGMDFVVGLPPSLVNGQVVDSILTVTCYLSKLVVLVPLRSTATAADVAEAFLVHVYRRFGMPDTVVSDRDPKFTGAFWSALNKRLGIRLAMSTSAHPQTDGRAEVTNKSVGQILRILCEDEPDAWGAALVACEFALNTSVSSATGISPFEIVHGFIPSSLPPLLGDADPPLAISSYADRARLRVLRATDAIIASRVAMTHEANKHRVSDAGVFVVGGQAYIATSGMRLPKGIASKFVPRFIGPYTITKADAATSTYTFDLPPHLRIHPTFHASKLRPHHPNDDARFPSRALAAPPPVIPASDAAEAEYEIEKVVEEKVVRGKTQYRVRYLGYSALEDQWRPASEIKALAPDALRDFKTLKAARSKAGLSAFLR